MRVSIAGVAWQRSAWYRAATMRMTDSDRRMGIDGQGGMR